MTRAWRGGGKNAEMIKVQKAINCGKSLCVEKTSKRPQGRIVGDKKGKKNQKGVLVAKATEQRITPLKKKNTSKKRGSP